MHVAVERIISQILFVSVNFFSVKQKERETDRQIQRENQGDKMIVGTNGFVTYIQHLLPNILQHSTQSVFVWILCAAALTQTSGFD